MASGTLDDYCVELADPQEEREAILRLWKTQGGDAGFYARQFDWFYLNGPPQGVHLYVLRHVNDGVVGCIAITKRLLQQDAQAVPVAAFDDFFVLDEHRALGPAVKLLRTALELEAGNFTLLYGTPNNKALPVFKRIGFVKQITLQRYVRMIKSRAFFRLCRPLSLFLPLAPVVDLFNWLSDQLKSLLLPRFNIEEVAECDSRFEQIWKNSQGYTLINQRDGGYLQWRFFENSRISHRMVLLTDAGSKDPVAYVVFHVEDDRFHIDDLFAVDKRHIAAAIYAFIRFVRAKRGSSISMWFHGDASLLAELKRLKMYSRDSQPVFYRMEDGEALSLSEWYFTDADRR